MPAIAKKKSSLTKGRPDGRGLSVEGRERLEQLVKSAKKFEIAVRDGRADAPSLLDEKRRQRSVGLFYEAIYRYLTRRR